MNTQERINKNGLAYIAGLKATARKLWSQACKADGIAHNEMFVVFSDDNKYAKMHDQCMAQLFEAETQYKAGGYVGLAIRGGKAR